MELTRCLVDCETGGLNFLTNALLTIAIIPVDESFNPIMDKVFTAKMYDSNYSVGLEALRVNGLYDYEKFGSYKSAFLKFHEWLAKNDIVSIAPIAHSLNFDMNFIKIWLGSEALVFDEREGRCTRMMLKLLKDLNLYEGKLSLNDGCTAFEVPLIHHHDCVADALACGGLYKAIIARFKENH